MIRSLCTVLALVFLLAACGGCGAYKVTVYGQQGKQYIAPDLCAAIIACQQAHEATCRYNSTLVTGADGKTSEQYACKTAK